MQDEREELERFLKKGASQGAPSSSEKDEKDELEAFLAGGKAATPTPTPFPTPTPTPTPSPPPPPRPKSTTPAYIPVTQRQEFGKRPLDSDRAFEESRRRNVGRQLTKEAELARTPVSLRRGAAPSFEEADRRITETVTDPAKMARLTPEERQFLQGTADYERRNLEITPRRGQIQGPPVFKAKRELKPGATARVGSMRPEDFDADVAERNILETVLDPSKASNYTADEWRALEETAQLIAERNREEQFQGRISQLVAQRAAEKAAAPSYPIQLANKIGRASTSTATSAIRGASLLHPEMEEDMRRMGVLQSPEESAEFLRRTLPVDPTDESLLAKGVEAAGSAVPFVGASAMAGAAGLPSWLAPAIFGAASNAGQTYEEAIAAGQDPESAKRAAIVGALIGLTEAVGGGRFGGKAADIAAAARRGALSELGLTVAKEYAEESIQEGVNQALNNVNAKIISGYDPRRAIEEGVGEAALLGGLVGVGYGGGLHLAGMVPAGLERMAERAAGAEAGRREPSASRGLPPSTSGPTQLFSLREATKPEVRKRLEEATTAPLGAATGPLAGPTTQPLTEPLTEPVTEPLTEPTAPLAELTAPLAGAAPTGAAPAPEAAQPEAAPADPLVAAIEALKSLRRPTKAEEKEAQKEAK